MTTIFSKRDLRTVNLPISHDNAEPVTSSVLLRFGSAGTLDIGALCYLRRGARQSSGSKCRPVDLSSLDEERESYIKLLIFQISEQFDKGSLRATSLIVDVSYFINFADWADDSGLKSFLADKISAQETLKVYIAYLHERVRTGALRLISAIRYQNSTVKLLSIYYQSDYFTEGIRLLKNNERSEPTSPPDELSQARLLKFCNALFEGLCSLVLNHKPFPYKLEIPDVPNWPVPYVWIFPTTRWVLPPHEQERRHTLSNGHWAFNYNDGTLADPDEIAHRYKGNYKQQIFIAKKNVHQAHLKILEANTDRNHQQRRDLAQLAHNVFTLLFLANTGINWAQVRSLSWDDSHTVGPTLQGFRAIKYRANNKVVSFEVGSVFMPSFKKFLELRAYLLQDQVFDKLFLGFGSNFRTDSIPHEMAEGMLDHLFRRLRKLDLTIPLILSRQWRAAKSDHLIRKHDVSTASLLLQNSEATIKKSYSAGSSVTAIDEMSIFFARLSPVILDSGTSVIMRSPIGACSAKGSPKSLDPTSSIKPDCQKLQGCLFCDKYRLHADEIDLRKLLSWRYFMQKTAYLTDSVEQFKTLFSETIERIDALLNALRARGDKALVERLSAEVEQQGELDPYWAAKLNMMLDLELI